MKDYTNYNFNNRNKAGAEAINTGQDVGLRAFMSKTYMHMMVGVLLSAFAAYFTMGSPEVYAKVAEYFLAFVIAELGIVVFLSFRVMNMSESAARLTFYSYALLNGVTLALIVAQYSHTAIIRAFFSTAIMFGAMSLYGMTTKKDLTSWGSFLFMGLFGVIIASLVNIFLKSAAMDFAVSIISVIVFTGLAAYDTQMLRRTYDSIGRENLGQAAVAGALRLYLDFINLFIQMLRLFGDRR